MQQGSTILLNLTVRPSISVSDPATPDGRLWNSALKTITRSQGWSQLHWGTQLAAEEVMDLLITWNSHPDLQHFMVHECRPFLTAIKHLLILGSDSSSIPSPYVMQLHPGMPSLDLGAVSSLYELSFDPQPNADLKTGLAIETQLCRNFLFDVAQEHSDGDSFLGMDAVWVRRYDQIPLPSPPSIAVDSATEEIRQRDESPQPATLLVITEWASQAAEKAILDSGKIEESRGGQVLTTGQYLTKNLLQQARTYTKHHVVFENVSASNVQWLDKDEKWSTYVARLMAEEDQRKHKETAEPGI